MKRHCKPIWARRLLTTNYHVITTQTGHSHPRPKLHNEKTESSDRENGRNHVVTGSSKQPSLFDVMPTNQQRHSTPDAVAAKATKLWEGFSREAGPYPDLADTELLIGRKFLSGCNNIIENVGL